MGRLIACFTCFPGYVDFRLKFITGSHIICESLFLGLLPLKRNNNSENVPKH